MATDTMGAQDTLRATTDEVIRGLNDLLQLDHDAIGGYEIAIEKLQDRDHADQIASFKRDHQNHIRDLNALIARLGGNPVNEPHATGPLKQAMQSLGALGGDRGILIAWRTNELQARNKYDSYASEAMHWPADSKRVVDQNALDEERHYEWVSRVLASYGEGAEGGSGTGVASRFREGTAQIGDVISNARDGVVARAGAAAETVRNRASQGMAGASRGVDGVEEHVRTSPAQSLLVTFAIGFVIGRLLR